MDHNPYKSPSAIPDQQSTRDDRLFRMMIKAYKKWRTNPPTVSRLLFAWSALPLSAAVGAVVVFALIAVEAPPELTFTMGGMYLGIALNQFTYTRRAVRIWRFQKDLMDWNVVEAAANELNL